METNVPRRRGLLYHLAEMAVDREIKETTKPPKKQVVQQVPAHSVSEVNIAVDHDEYDEAEEYYAEQERVTQFNMLQGLDLL